MKSSQTIKAILPKLYAVKQELEALNKNATNPHLRNNYADLNSHIESVEPLLSKHRLLLMQPTMNNAGVNTVETMIFDIDSGEFIISDMTLILPKNDMQAVGSAVTYARRYTLGALFAMRAEDDDGNEASGNGASTRKPLPPKPKSAATAKVNDDF